MKKVLLASGLVALTGCSSLVAPLASDVTASSGDIIRIAYSEPEAVYNCVEKGLTAFNPNMQSIMGVLELGPNQAEAETLINKNFADAAAAVQANYIERDFSSTSTFGGVYGRSNSVEATFYQCETLPTI
ncbi:hypothetical protein F0231_16900 [Vibrio sp. RE86]|uniref:hypothetical protein n=1 Tax=Vibrio sp. RE86 TaxID=2607605 RepID=UPI001493A572|nr:hypothetical protein [Vibrio sp. RE86]NOH81425.1 hypothetical protein [Vibrio sp. RE86]